MKARYILVELEDSYFYDAIVNEIILYDENRNKINYITTETGAYDSITNSTPRYWVREIWDRTKLNNNKNTAGDNESTIFLSDGNLVSGKKGWVRFYLDLMEEKEISKIEFWVGSEKPDYQKRHTKIVRIFITNNNPLNYLTPTRLVDDNLILTHEISLPPILSSALDIIKTFFVVNSVFLFKKDNLIYTIENNALKSLGTITTANASTLFKSGVEAITKEHCALVGQQLGKAKIMRMLV